MFNQDIKVEKFSKKLKCGATISGFREIISKHPGYDAERLEINEPYLEEN